LKGKRVKEADEAEAYQVEEVISCLIVVIRFWIMPEMRLERKIASLQIDLSMRQS
jgi:hypothetical protein